MTRLLGAALLSVLAGPGLAQESPHLPCRADDLTLVKPLDQFTPEELAAMAHDAAVLEQFTREFEGEWAPGQRANYIVPIVFHIIHNNGPENISDEQIYDAVRVLNEDFNKLNPDWTSVRPEFIDLVADVGIEFRLARKDPQGNCTNGITRTVSPLTNDGTQTMKNLIQWPRNRYLNVWVAASANGAAGYTYRPGAVNNNPTWDGIVLLHSYTGSIGTSSPSRSRTLTHEVGHWINLKHTWGGTNEPGLSSNCNDDDDVSDTPNTIGWTSCFLSGTSCGSLDNVQNYMEYSYCSRMFTTGQATRMIAALNSSTAQRNQLHTASNLAFTGVSLPETLCAAAFSQSTSAVCQGTQVAFTDQSYHGVVSRTWEFPGATPSTSTEANPTVTYDQAGTFPVTLTVSDGVNTLSTTVQNAITVQANPGLTPPYSEGFEDHSSLGASPWSVVNPDNGNGFTLTTAAAHTGSQSVRLLNTAAQAGQKDELISETIDMSGESGILVTFRYAFAQRTSGNDDRLRFYVSNNCGNSWIMRKQLRGSTDMNTGGIVTGSFTPTAGQWGLAVVDNIPVSHLVPDFRMRFEFESAGGNNLYLDDININGSPVSVAGVDGPAPTALAVLPNPVEGDAQAMFTLEGGGNVRLTLLDVLGRELARVHEGRLPAGTHRMDLPVQGLSSGLYFVRLALATEDRVVRFAVE